MITVPICGSSPLVASQSDASYFHKTGMVADLYQLMREQSGDKGTPQRSISSAAQLVSLCADISPSSSHFFEVLYVGKIKISHRKVPESFIDDALDKFHAHESDKSTAAGQHVGAEVLRRDSADSTASHESTLSLEPTAAVTPCESGTESSTDGTAGAIHSKHVGEHNRTMVLQVGRNDLRLISPDRKLVLLHKQHRDVASCVQGLRDPDHFGFICRDHHHPPQQVTTPTAVASSTYIGYVFKCESASVASDAVNAVSQAFTNSETSCTAGRVIIEKQRPPLTSCDHCPMVWYHRLCAEVENLSDRKTQAAIFRRIDQLDEEEQATIVTKFKGVETDSMREQNEFLMMLLRAHCEMKQNRHVHDTAEQRSEFLHHYLGAGSVAGGITGGMGHGIFTKAKRSLSSSFDHLLKRKASRDDVGVTTRSELSLPVTDTAVTPTSYRGISPEAPSNQGLRSPMMDMFMKVGSSSGSPRMSTSEDGSGPVEPHRTPGGSWRQAIFHRVSTARPADCSPARSEVAHTRTRAELRALWKRAIKQAVLLVRMERENARLRARQEETAVKRIKLEYDDLCPESYADTGELWDSLLGSQHQRCSERPQPDERLLQQAVLGGVPRVLRGELWQLLADRQASRHPPPAAAAYHPNYAAPYSELLRQLTSHQHAILIDLGRTFPQHAYFAAPLGPGQLSLFNLLKAYSLLDPEVGYCQGLSFVAGVLLLHADEADAYRLLRHLMFSRGLRALYLPDMEALQVQLYQLSRMLLDRLPTLYAHLDINDVSPTLYAAPWLLTMFASQFPLGFVARVLDLVFLEGADVLLRVALALLAEHEEALLACDGFERIMEHLKGELPAAGPKALDLAIRRACHQPEATARQLAEYRVEYHVLREEAVGAKVQAETVSRLETECATLRDHASQLAQQLEMALGNVQRLERNRALQQAAHNRLEVQARGLEVSVATLGAFIDQLVEDKVDVQIPGEVRRIVSQLSVAECRRRAGGAMNVASTIPTAAAPRSHLMVKSLSTGRIATPAMIKDGEMQRCNSLNTQAELRSSALPGLRVLAEEERPTTAPTKPTSLGTKMSHFFSTSHSHILQNKLSGTGVKQVIREDSREGLLTPPPTEAPGDGQPNFQDAISSEPTEPTVSPAEPTEQAAAPTDTAADSPTSSIDSGVGTPISPKHPLSNCDVNFTFNGTTKLKNIRNMSRNLSRNSSPDLLGK